MPATCDKAWFGWPCDPENTRLRQEFAEETDDAKRREIIGKLLQRESENPTHGFLGQYTTPMAVRAKHHRQRGLAGAGVLEHREEVTYVVTVLLLTVVLPIGSAVAEHLVGQGGSWIVLFGAWMTFWAVGVRLFLAGVKQVRNPRFTAETLFGLKGDEPLPIVRELGSPTCRWACSDC